MSAKAWAPLVEAMAEWSALHPCAGLAVDSSAPSAPSGPRGEVAQQDERALEAEAALAATDARAPSMLTRVLLLRLWPTLLLTRSPHTAFARPRLFHFPSR